MVDHGNHDLLIVLLKFALNRVEQSNGDETIRKFKDDVDGVAAVIGTIMALMVFLAFISLFVLYWVPVMMEDNEARHMRTVLDQFGDLKVAVDDQILKDNKNSTPFSPIKLGADGVPMFERESPGELSLRLNSEFFNCTFQDSGEDIFENTSGSIDLVVYNRFYVMQTLIYENGAVFIHQKQGDVLKVEPTFNVEVEGDNVRLSATLISLLHDNDNSIAGIGLEGVTTRLYYTDRWTYTNITSPNRGVTFNISSRYTDAWNKYYDGALSNAGLVEGVDYNITTDSNKLSISIDRVSELSLSHAFVKTYIGKATT
ncbi:MAG: hypothetical protein V3U20_03400 [Thermoplasmata archaeon]